MSDLKPCPFCGWDAVAGPFATEGVLGFWQCGNPVCVANQDQQGGIGPDDWNRRAMPECVGELLMRMEEDEMTDYQRILVAAVREYYGEKP